MSDPKTIKELHKEARDYRYKKAAKNISLLNGGLFLLFWILFLSDVHWWMMNQDSKFSITGVVAFAAIGWLSTTLQRKWFPIPDDSRTEDRIGIGAGISLVINLFLGWACIRLNLVQEVESPFLDLMGNAFFYGIVGAGTWLAVGLMNYFCGPRKGYWFVHDDE